MHQGRVQAREGIVPLLAGMERTPLVAFWEITRACALACRHCRAVAQPQRHPEELSTQEGFRLLDELTSFDSPPLVVLSGGDPFMRRDLFSLVEYGIGRGLRVSVSPSVTALVTPQRLRRLRDAGVSRISLSLDGSSPGIHDSFRGVQGSFDRTLQCIGDALDLGLGLQVNTTVSRYNVADLPEMARLVASLGVVVWDLFFLVPTGRGSSADMLSAQGHEEAYHTLYALEERFPFSIKVTLGQPFRRVWVQRRLAAEGWSTLSQDPWEVVNRWEGGAPANDGKGILFVSHVGEVFPSGFLPLKVGNVREESVADLYRNASVFQALRDPEALKGKCGRCPFRVLCGGCRARAFALSGDILAADPTCPFDPLSGSGEEVVSLPT